MAISGREARNAGTMPKSAAAKSAATAVKAITAGSMAMVIETRQGGWGKRAEFADAGVGEGQAEGGAYARRGRGLRPGSDEPGPNGCRPCAVRTASSRSRSGRTDQHEVGDVGAGDQQEDDDGAHQGQQRGADLLDDVCVHGLDADA